MGWREYFFEDGFNSDFTSADIYDIWDSWVPKGGDTTKEAFYYFMAGIIARESYHGLS